MSLLDNHMSIYDYSLDQLRTLEEKETQLSSFTADDAWKLGSLARSMAIKHFPNTSLVIDISLASGQCLFHASSGTGVFLNNDIWVSRKKNLVVRTGMSSFFNGQKLRIKKVSIEEGLYVDGKDYAAHGGSIPLKVKNFDNLIGTFTVSGLPQSQDHVFVITVLKEFVKSQ